MLEVLILVMIGFGIFYMRRKKKKRINATYVTDQGEFAIKGNMDRFIVKKDDRYEFLVDKGVIIACKDKQIHKKFVYYGGEENVK
ncbi:hypothetical protein ACERII_17965 [Evansella sp. AB-rgal1]|uniref:hypothetical protein n=1 Tax=Evansella sp. AB-rgal1 TaxID=3242696 RepID=UPI00359DDBB7